MNIFSILIPKQMLTYLSDQDPLNQAVHFLLGSTYSAVPVIDAEGHYIGIASEGDFLRGVMEYGEEDLVNHRVADIVNRDFGAVVLNTVEKKEIMDKILDRNFLCVIDDRKCFIGIITRKSIIQYLNDGNVTA
ncbi:MAG: CBS domain-containing protein [Wujia sp.]